MRFALRGVALTFVLITLLLGGVMAASGAFRPVRFFVATGEIQWPVILVSDAGETFTIPTILGDKMRIFQNRIVWLNQDAYLYFWENGQLQIMGRLWQTDTDVRNAERSPHGLVAWDEKVSEHFDLMVWDGMASRNIAPESENLAVFFWTPENALLWIDSDTSGSWRLRRWQEGVVTDLSAGNEPVIWTRNFDCEIVALYFEDSVSLYHDGQLIVVPDSLSKFTNLQTEDCQTYLLKGVGSLDDPYDVIWNGAEETRLAFEVDDIRGHDEVIGHQIGPENQFTLIHQQNNAQQTHNWDLTEPIMYPALLFWEGPSSLWRILQGEDTVLLFWNHETGQTSQLVLNPNANGHPGYDQTSESAAWLEATELSTVRLTIWQHRQLEQHTLQISDHPVSILEATLHWMNDNTLILGVVENTVQVENRQRISHLYRWDGQQLELLTTLPVNTGPISDWMTWE